MEDDSTKLRIGNHEFHGWKADVIVFGSAAVILGIAFLAGLAVGMSA